MYRFRKFLLNKILHADDTPHAIALGVALAILVAFLPLVGFQTAIAIGLAALFHANKAVCIPVVWITNPLTLGPIYGACWALGRWIMSSPVTTRSAEVLSKLQEDQQTFRLFELESWKNLLSRLVGLGTELWLGCAVVGLVAAVLSYFISRRGVRSYRERRRKRILRRDLYRSKRRAGIVTRRREPA